ncbi:MAG: peptidoglycan-binding domain-containing protein [Xanthobacteraceae bacterium]
MPADPAVKAIQEKLAEIGFTFVGKPDGVLGARTRMAVREFQHYASKEYVAKLKNGAPPSRYIDGLERVKNNHRFPVNYKPNGRHDLPAPDQTLTLLDAWWQAKYRCPVVVEARRRVAAGEVIPAFGNLWLYDDPVVTDFLIRNKVRSKISGALLEFRAADFSVAAPQTEWLSMPIVGSMYIYGRYRGGVTFNTAHLEDDLEYLPENLTGQNWGQLGNEGKVLFRIVRTMAEQECRGFFDCLNGYDNAVMSLGPCHWTLALGCGTPPRKKNTKMLSGELAPFLAYVIGRHPDVLKDHFAPYGVSVKGDWPSGSSGAAFKGSWEATRNFLGRLQWWTGGPRDEEIAQFQDLQWFRTTHWFHRFVVMSRTSPELRLRQWDMVRMRLRDILICKLGGNGPYRDNRIGDLYTSDLSLALLAALPCAPL